MLNALLLADANATKFAIAVVHEDKVVYQPKPMTALTARLLAHEKTLDRSTRRTAIAS